MTSITPQNGKILVGTASWSDPGFIQHWYPKKLRPHERLSWYAQYFEMVEVNSTFYSIPDLRMVERWCAATPDGFIFDVKLHRLLSRHSASAKFLPADLQRCPEIDTKGKVQLTPALEEALVEAFLHSISIVRSAGKHKHKLVELEHLIDMLRDYQLAIEFRNRNWVIGEQLRETVEFLERHRATFVNVDAPAAEHFTIMPSNLNEITNPHLAYLRLHGRNARGYLTGKTVAARFDYDYTDSEIAEIAERGKKLARTTRELHVIFNNNNLDYAPRAAVRLRVALGQLLSTPPQTPELF